MNLTRDRLDLDVLFVGGGPANLAGALHLKHLVDEHNRAVQSRARTGPILEPSIGIIEKGRDCGAHALSGAIIDDRALRELLPRYWEPGLGERDFPGWVAVRRADLYYLTEKRHYRIPSRLLPRALRHDGCYMGSLQRLNLWLAELVEEAGAYLFPSTCGVELLIEGERVAGVRTGDRGLDAHGRPQANYEPGERIHAKITVLGEGPRGTLSEDLIHHFRLHEGRPPQSYGIGVKELIRVRHRNESGLAVHTVGYPLQRDVFGGGFCYELSDSLYAVGLVCALDWEDPRMDPHAQLQRLKSHPLFRRMLHGGEVIAYGAKTIPEGGYFAIPRLYADGALLVGDAAGLVNVPYLKGIHYGMKSGMLAAATIFEMLLSEALQPGFLAERDASSRLLASYETRVLESYIGRDLYRVRNFRRAFGHGRIPGILLGGLGVQTGIGPKRPGRISKDFECLQPVRERPTGHCAAESDPPDTPLVVDKPASVHLSDTRHRENQPSHIRILDPARCFSECVPRYGDAACTHFCPAGVYEIAGVGPDRRIKVNFTNCVHCKTCVIKDPIDVDPSDGIQNIDWRAPAEGGPRYRGL
ncbi:MAG: electron-transfer flavoprotein:ubiquinone oxidoreductase [Planctomycetota bacterium]